MRTFDWLKKTELVEMKYCFYNEDPVRPELDNKFRTSLGRKIFGLKLGKDVIAVCVLHLHMKFQKI